MNKQISLVEKKAFLIFNQFSWIDSIRRRTE